MKIKEAAELTGTTVRTIRWYHQQGLLPVPPVRGTQRDYDLEHVARVLRVRWLAQAGLPLDAIRELLSREPQDPDFPAAPQAHPDAPAPGHPDDDGAPLTPDPTHALRDLHATLEQIDTAIEALHDQRTRVLQLIDSAEAGRGLSSVSPEISRIYDRFEAAVPHDPHILRVLRRERRMAEMLTQRGLMRDDMMSALSMDEISVEECADFLVRFAGIRNVSEEDLESATASLVEDMLTWCGNHPDLMRLYLAVLPGWNTAVERSIVLRLLMLEYRDPRQREILRRVLDGLNQMIDQGVFSDATDGASMETGTMS